MANSQNRERQSDLDPELERADTARRERERALTATERLVRADALLKEARIIQSLPRSG